MVVLFTFVLSYFIELVHFKTDYFFIELEYKFIVLKTDFNFTEEILEGIDAGIDLFDSTLVSNSNFHLLRISNYMIYCVMEFGWFLLCFIGTYIALHLEDLHSLFR